MFFMPKPVNGVYNSKYFVGFFVHQLVRMCLFFTAQVCIK